MKKTNFKLSLLLFLLIISYYAKAQSYSIQGKVITIDGEPVSDARIWIVNNNNIFEQFNTYTDAYGMYSISVTGIKDEEAIPTSYKLSQNYPNPFAEKTEIDFSAQVDEQFTLKIYDILGREVKSFSVQPHLYNNKYRIAWDGTNNNGSKVSTGIYFYRLSGRNISLTKKMLLIPGSNNFSTPLSSLVKESIIEKKYNQTNSYEIILTNITGTSPLINAQKISSLDLTADTTLNFTAERKTDPGYYLYALCDTIIYVVDTYTNTIIDSIYGFNGLPRSFEINSDNKLYLSTEQPPPYPAPSLVYSIDLLTKNMKIIRSYDFQTNGGFVSVFYKNYDTVFIITKDPNSQLKYLGIIENDSVKYFDSLDIGNVILGFKKQNLVFDRDSTVFYVMNSNNYLFAYNYSLKRITRMYNNIYSPLHMIISDDNHFMYVSGGPVFDFHKDSVLAWVSGNNLGSLALNSDNSKLYITDPGHYYNLEYSKTGKVFGYRTDTYTYSDTIDVFKARLDYWKVTDAIEIIPNTNLAYVSDFGSYIYIIDLGLNEVIQTIYFPLLQVSSFILKNK